MALPFSYTLRRSPRTGKLRLIVRGGQVEVVAPPGVPEAIIGHFVASQQQWVLQALDKAASRLGQSQRQMAFYRPGAELVFQGRPHAIAITQTATDGIAVTITDRVNISLPAGLAQPQAAIEAALADWMKAQAAETVARLAARYGAEHGLRPRSITVKRQKSRWGSCGIHNDIHINWLLVAAPPAVLEYVLVHELCHLNTKNHSAQFWAQVARLMPDYRQHRRWLNEHGANLMQSWP